MFMGNLYYFLININKEKWYSIFFYNMNKGQFLQVFSMVATRVNKRFKVGTGNIIACIGLHNGSENLEEQNLKVGDLLVRVIQHG